MPQSQTAANPQHQEEEEKNEKKLNKNQKWDPLRAMKTFIRRKVGHTT